MPEKVFVYGTLMNGHYNHFYMERDGIKFLGKGRADGFSLYNVTPYYPGAVREEGESVLGEVYEVPDMRELDALEGNGFLYQREKIPVVMENGDILECWIYLWLNRYWIRPELKVPLEQQPWKRSRMKICDKCDGEGRWDCNTCGEEEIREDCSECHGEGWTLCPVCNGRGFVIRDREEVT